MVKFKTIEQMKQHLDSCRLKREKKKFNKTMGYMDYAQFTDLMGILRENRVQLRVAYAIHSNKRLVEFLDRKGWTKDIIDDFFYEGLNRSCFSCLMNSVKYICVNKEYKDIICSEDLPDYIFQKSRRQMSVLFALFGEDPLECKHRKNLCGSGAKPIVTFMSIMFSKIVTLNYDEHLEKIYSSKNKSPDSQMHMAEIKSRYSSTSVRFPWISRLICQEMVENIEYFSDLKKITMNCGNNFDGVFDDIVNLITSSDIYKDRYIVTKNDISWEFLNALSSEVNQIKNRFGDPVEARDVIEWNSSIFSAIYKYHRVVKRGGCIVIADLHEFGYGLHKTLLEYPRKYEGKEGLPFEKTVQQILSKLIQDDGIKILYDAEVVKNGYGIKYQSDFILSLDDALILGECKDKGRYDDPGAGVEHINRDIKGKGWKQLMDQENALLDSESPGYIKTKDGDNLPADVSNIIQIVVHNHDYVYPDYKAQSCEELYKESKGTHFFSLEGLIMALYTSMGSEDFLRYLKFRQAYIEFWKSRNIEGILMDEFDICVSYVNGDKGRYSIVSYECESQHMWNIPSMEEWNIFLKSICNPDCGTGICKDNIKSGVGIKMNIPNDECEKMKDINDLICFQFKG